MKNIDSGKVFEAELELEIGLSDRRVDEHWCSDLCKKKVSNAVITRYPCKQQFSRIDVIPLYACGVGRFYRVTLWVNDWSTGLLPVKTIWKTFYVTLEGIERNVVSIEEDRKKKLALTDKGLRFMDELEVTNTKKE